MQSEVLKFVVFAAFISRVLCDALSACKVNEFQCADLRKCTSMRYRCDGDRDCGSQDYSDETDCPPQQCGNNGLVCDSGECRSRTEFCDGTKHCQDNSDEKECGYEDSDILFLNEGLDIYMKKRTKTGLEFTHLIPISSRMKRTGYHSGMKITGLSFDVRNWTLFISDARRPVIFAVNVTSLNTRDLVTDYITSPQDIAFDWTSNNLYWVDSGSGMAEVVSVDTLRRIVIVRDLPHPLSLALSPNTGTMFIATTTGFEACVFMYGMDGSNRRILDSVQGSPASLALHPTKSILYWTDPEEGTVSYVNYSSAGEPKILKKSIDRVMSVAVTERDVYITTGEPVSSERVLRVKNPGFEKDEGWKSISSGMKPSGKYECLIENGGCEHLCLTSEIGRTCACASGKTLGEDGKNCLG